MSSAIVAVYVRLVIRKLRTFESVPAEGQAQVAAALAEQGYDTDGNEV